MKQILISIILALLLGSCTSEKKAQKPNILLICIDDLRPELNCFDAAYIQSPNIDQLAKQGMAFRNHYVNAPSCGPSRYTLLTGQYGPAGNSALFLRSAAYTRNSEAVQPSMPEYFRNNGYTTVSVGKVSHHPGGRGGNDWNDSTSIEIPLAWDRHLMPVGEWEHPRGAMHGLAHGEIRKDSKEMDVFQSAEGADDIYPDGLIAREGIKQLHALAQSDQPFFLAIGLIKPHLPFGAPAQYMTPYKNIQLPPIQHPEKPQGQTTWHDSGEFMRYNRWGKDPREDADFAEEVRKHYAACVTYADMHVGKILAELKASGADKNTIIVLWGDHGWHLGEHAIWGKHSLFEEALHSPLIVYFPGMMQSGKETTSVVETLDIFPTLCDLSGLEKPSYAKGISLKPILEDPFSEGHTALGYSNGNSTIRTASHRLTLHQNGFVELYDHETMQGETENIADEKPELVDELKSQLTAKLNMQQQYKQD